jgi:hypothetical protein
LSIVLAPIVLTKWIAMCTKSTVKTRDSIAAGVKELGGGDGDCDCDCAGRDSLEESDGSIG